MRDLTVVSLASVQVASGIAMLTATVFLASDATLVIDGGFIAW